MVKTKMPHGALNSLSPDPSPVREGSLKPLKLLNFKLLNYYARKDI